MPNARCRRPGANGYMTENQCQRPEAVGQMPDTICQRPETKGQQAIGQSQLSAARHKTLPPRPQSKHPKNFNSKKENRISSIEGIADVLEERGYASGVQNSWYSASASFAAEPTSCHHFKKATKKSSAAHSVAQTDEPKEPDQEQQKCDGDV